MKTNQTNPLEQHGFRLGQKVSSPDQFKVSAAWTSPKYRFQLDAEQGIGRRISSDANPTVYFRIYPIGRPERAQKPKSNQLLRGSLATVAAAAALLLLYPLYPAAQYQVQKTVAETVSHTNALAAAPQQVSIANRVVIPKIGVDTSILEGTSLAVLNKQDGVWHETGTENDNLVLAGHRFKYLPPNSTTLYNLDKLSAGDTIVIDWYHKRYIYVVTDTKVVTKHDISVRNPTPTPTLTIYSCEEKNQAHRIVVTAKRLD